MADEQATPLLYGNCNGRPCGNITASEMLIASLASAEKERDELRAKVKTLEVTIRVLQSNADDAVRKIDNARYILAQVEGYSRVEGSASFRAKLITQLQQVLE